MIDEDIHKLAEANNVQLPSRNNIHLKYGQECNIGEFDEYYDGWRCGCGATGSWHDVDNGHIIPYPSYSTDELFRILPIEIDGYSRVTWGYYCGYASIYVNRPILKWIQNIPYRKLNQALKELLKWVIENYPDQLREHLNKLKGE